MKTLASLLTLAVAVVFATAQPDFVSAQPWKTPPSSPPVGADGRDRHHFDVPQDLVVCTGWHALCSIATDCRVKGDTADCDCLQVNETHIVMTGEIQDPVAKRLTLGKCTVAHPCDVDEAPVCKAIADGKYRVSGVRYDWVSTYSYRGWCGVLPKFRPCEPGTQGYAGDSVWAICDVAPCTENPHPYDANRPLTCQCRVVGNEAFVGTNGSCSGDRGGIMSSFAMSAWNFQSNAYTLPVPGYEWVQGACAAYRSDPLD